MAGRRGTSTTLAASCSNNCEAMGGINLSENVNIHAMLASSATHTHLDFPTPLSPIINSLRVVNTSSSIFLVGAALTCSCRRLFTVNCTYLFSKQLSANSSADSLLVTQLPPSTRDVTQSHDGWKWKENKIWIRRQYFNPIVLLCTWRWIEFC